MRSLLFPALFISFITHTKAQVVADGSLIFDHSDLMIIERADAILSDSSKWNKHDDRECSDDITTEKYSLFCALYKASIDITGTYAHRRAAMQIVRLTIEKNDNGRITHHRLMDWNNSARTTFTELKKVLKESAATVKRQLK